MSITEIHEKINSLEFSLKTICAVNVVHRIIESVGVKKAGYKSNGLTRTLGWIETEAAKRVEKLTLRTSEKQLLAGLIKPIYRELDRWYSDYRYDVTPLWSPYGTVDMVQSTRIVVEDPKSDIFFRFLVACTFCHERQIFELAQLLTDHQVAIIDNNDYCTGQEVRYVQIPLAKFLLDICKHGGLPFTREELEKGLEIAMDLRECAATKYFLEKLKTAEGVRNIVKKRSHSSTLFDYRFQPPATMCSLFSEIRDNDLRLNSFDEFVNALLTSLTQWPYQPLFLDAARSLSVHATERTLHRVLYRVIWRATDGYEDYDYRGLFISFWEIIDLLHPDCAMDEPFCIGIAADSLLTEDELWMNWVFSKFSDDEKEHLLLGNHFGMCADLIRWQKSHLLEPFIRLCSANRIDLLLLFNDTVQLPKAMFRRKWNGETEGGIGMRQIYQVVDKIIADQENTSDWMTPQLLKSRRFKKRRVRCTIL